MLDLNSRARALRLHPAAHRELGPLRGQRPSVGDRPVHERPQAARSRASSPRRCSIRACGRRSPGTGARPTASPSRRSPCTSGTARTCSIGPDGAGRAFKAKYGYDMQVPADLGPVPRSGRVVHPPRAGLSTAPRSRASATRRCGTSGSTFLYSFGGDMMEVNSGSECGPIIVNSPEAVASLDYYKSLVQYSRRPTRSTTSGTTSWSPCSRPRPSR